MVIINVMNTVLEFVTICPLEQDISVPFYICVCVCYRSKSYKFLTILKLQVHISINMLIFNPQISL